MKLLPWSFFLIKLHSWGWYLTRRGTLSRCFPVDFASFTEYVVIEHLTASDTKRIEMQKFTNVTKHFVLPKWPITGDCMALKTT